MSELFAIVKTFQDISIQGIRSGMKMAEQKYILLITSAIKELEKGIDDKCPSDGCDIESSPAYHWRGCPKEGSTIKIVRMLSEAVRAEKEAQP